ncbi:hypothetical protein IPL68_00815 [Candidatus Saccharibacteria bacterium]|nr:MAG: hypothetical protein IPL68_00815 [Candidatus Saccharibacteria bacterium]
MDYAVIETGMGGLDDSTNVAARADKLCVITDIGYDHMEALGDTLGKIAYQKPVLSTRATRRSCTLKTQRICRWFVSGLANKKEPTC